MNKKMGSRAIVIRIGLALASTAISAAAFATISVAAKDDGGGSNDSSANGAETRAFVGPPGGPLANLSDEDRQKLEDFRQCMSEHGAEPPEPSRFDPDSPPKPPKPPSSDEIEKIQAAHEACKEKLPEDLQDMPGPRFRVGGCAPGGPPPARKESGSEEDDNQSQGFVIPAPAPSGTS